MSDSYENTGLYCPFNGIQCLGRLCACAVVFEREGVTSFRCGLSHVRGDVFEYPLVVGFERGGADG